MSTVDLYHKKITNLIKTKYTENKMFLPNEFLNFKNLLIIDLKNKFKKDFDEKLALKLIDEQFKINLIYSSSKESRECPTGISEVNFKDIKIPKEYIKAEKHFQKLFATPQPDQRSEEWYLFRKGRITASDIATALDHNPYEAWEEFIIKKCDPDYPFYDNDTVFHGKKYEEVATMIYQEIFNVRVTEFGCLPSTEYSFLGASPDGICSKATLDYKFSPKLNTMLEIKCPVRRKIINKGKIKGEICPHYYEYQCQVQMQCCGLKDCDFWQCDIEEIDYQTYLQNKIIPESTCGTDASPLDLPTYCHQGLIMQFLPKNYKPRFENKMFHGQKQNDNIKFQGKIIYPPHLKFNYIEYNCWVIETLSNLEQTHPDLVKNYYFDKVIYWRLKKCHNVLITRNDEWFKKYLPILENTWNQVLYYRKNLNKIPKLQNKSNRKRDLWKMKTDYTIMSKEFTKNKTLFLNDDIDDDISNNSPIECDFID